ncbi:CO2+/Mg2+ efflux protein ApaG [Acetobacter orientalis]|uniref:CO2+/Mg2+ efflux protein ApaG n=1 Tax=Acetobacter orientalis TaxID=146474 RepID=A0A2Z5ZFG0_9PROT|nr:CO2+/Mg2+ efflux protein ApaG [Acetobacter orientalis]
MSAFLPRHFMIGAKAQLPCAWGKRRFLSSFAARTFSALRSTYAPCLTGRPLRPRLMTQKTL